MKRLIRAIRCRFRGHKMHCIQTVILLPQNQADVEHEHHCFTCGFIRFLPTEALEAEVILILNELIGGWGEQRVETNFEPPRYMH